MGATQSEKTLDDSEGLFEDKEERWNDHVKRCLINKVVGQKILWCFHYRHHYATCRVKTGTILNAVSPMTPQQKQKPQLLIAIELHKVHHLQSTIPPVLKHQQSQPSNSLQTVSCSHSLIPLATQSYNIFVSTQTTLTNGLSTINSYATKIQI